MFCLPNTHFYGLWGDKSLPVGLSLLNLVKVLSAVRNTHNKADAAHCH